MESKGSGIHDDKGGTNALGWVKRVGKLPLIFSQSMLKGRKSLKTIVVNMKSQMNAIRNITWRRKYTPKMIKYRIFKFCGINSPRNRDFAAGATAFNTAKFTNTGCIEKPCNRYVGMKQYQKTFLYPHIYIRPTHPLKLCSPSYLCDLIFCDYDYGGDQNTQENIWPKKR